MLSGEVLSIPLHPYLRPEEQEPIAQTMRRFAMTSLAMMPVDGTG